MPHVLAIRDTADAGVVVGRATASARAAFSGSISVVDCPGICRDKRLLMAGVGGAVQPNHAALSLDVACIAAGSNLLLRNV